MGKFDVLKEKILHLRKYGTVRCELVPTENKDTSSSLLNMLGRIDILSEPANSSSLKEIDRDLAQRIIAQILFKDMAYGIAIMDGKVSSELARDFISLFSENAKFFSSEGEDFIKFQQKEITAYSAGAITSATVSVGIFVVDSLFGGFIVVEDED